MPLMRTLTLSVLRFGRQASGAFGYKHMRLSRERQAGPSRRLQAASRQSVAVHGSALVIDGTYKVYE
eukprot:1161840-Pelagomonas_calceolata.AAC.7